MKKIALLLQHYFPYGGLQRDCLNMAVRLASKGHAPSVVTRCWEGEKPEGIDVVELGSRGASNMAMDKHFDNDVGRWLNERDFDCVVGFSRLMTRMDFYYAADPCYALRIERNKPAWYRYTPRFRHAYGLEKHLFSRGNQTRIMLLTDMEVSAYQDLYGTEDERLLVLPPSIRRRDLCMDSKETLRQETRKREGWGDEKVVLFVGSGFATKGLDRAIRACAEVGCVLLVAGTGKTGKYQSLAKQCRASNKVRFLGGRDDAWELMAAADLLIHPARSENTGTVLLEALSAGTGVLCTDRCGFANHISASKSGAVLESPFDQGNLTKALQKLLVGDWRDRAVSALAYASTEDLYSGMEKATGHVETFLRS